MQFPSAPPADTTALSQSIADLTASLSAVTPLGPFTVATLPNPQASILGRVATVTDLFGNRTSRCRCEKVTLAGSPDLYFWQPLSSDSYGALTTAANVSLLPLSTPQTIGLTGNILAGITRNITLETTGGWPGCIKEVRSDATLGLASGLNILGTGLGSGVSLLLGGYKKFGLEYTSAGLTWRPLV